MLFSKRLKPGSWRLISIGTTSCSVALFLIGFGCSSVGPAKIGAPPEEMPGGEPPEGLALFHVPFRIGKTSLPRISVAADGRSFETAGSKPFVPFGVTYFRAGTGWAPQVWKQFDAEATRRDFALMKELGVNCVRVFLSYGSFYRKPGELDNAGLAKFDQFLSIAEQAGIYVQPTGPDLWEGQPEWLAADRIADENSLNALEHFWRFFATRYRSRNVIFAYELLNEPEVGWDSETMRAKWRRWLERKYISIDALRSAWDQGGISFETAAIPAGTNAPGNLVLLDYQEFRESLADDWTARQAGAIRSVDRNALVTVGLIQWSVPALLASPKHYSAFRPARQASFLNFLEIHFYPFEHGPYEYRDDESETRNLSYLQSVVREASRPGKPVVLAEFGWYGGGKPRFDESRHPEATEEQQARWCRNVIFATRGLACGWLNWGLYDQPDATDVSEFTGLLTSEGRVKAWGKVFRELGAEMEHARFQDSRPGHEPALDWAACVTDTHAGTAFREKYLQTYLQPATPSGTKQP